MLLCDSFTFSTKTDSKNLKRGDIQKTHNWINFLYSKVWSVIHVTASEQGQQYTCPTRESNMEHVHF